MIPVMGRAWKDCMRVCVASILEKSYEEVPFVDPDLPIEAFWSDYHKIFKEFGFMTMTLSPDLMVHEEFNFQGFSIGMGKSIKSGQDHAVVCEGTKIVYDPGNAGIAKMELHLLFIPLYPWKMRTTETEKVLND